MSASTLPRAAQARATALPGVYRAVWRWHFYAGLIALPFLVLLAVTGGLFLFRAELETLIHRDILRVEQQATPPRPPEALVAAALAAQPGTAFRFTPGPGPADSAQIGIRTAEGQRVIAYLDPYDARVLGMLPDKGTVMWFVRQLHSLAWFGPIANGIIEVVAGWSILLVGTGLYLWWPRGPREARGGALSVRGSPRRRPFWKSLHGVLGVFTAGFIVFLAVTGMPWSVFWGKYANQWANGHNFGYPAGVRVSVPISAVPLAESGPVAWSLQQARLPESDPHAGHGAADTGGHDHGQAMPAPSTQPGPSAGTAAIGLNAAVAEFARLGLAPGYAVALPSGPRGVYTGSAYPDDLSQQRVVHLDQYSGRLLLDTGYADYGPLGRGLEWGINVHLGQQYGLVNKLVLLAACLGIVALAVSGGVMWWKRRPAGSLGLPPAPAERRLMLGVAAILAIGGVIFPLVGASMLAMLALDAVFTRRRPRPA
jgi:uncharacterized iron-regulated membrane protein